MLNNFIGGGQVFLHKIRMFKQVAGSSIMVALLLGGVVTFAVYLDDASALDWRAVSSYRRAWLADGFDDVMNPVREIIGTHGEHISYIDAYSRFGVIGYDLDPRRVMRIGVLVAADQEAINLLKDASGVLLGSVISLLLLIFMVWAGFGKATKSEKKISGGVLLTTKEVAKKLKSLKKASAFHIGDMPLVKDSETRHFLVTGSTGSGKTNLIHNLLPQVAERKDPAIVIDQTGEMIAKYYNPQRGDIIFNPFDQRGHIWNFWHDCSNNEELERFSKILFSFNRKKSGTHSDPFWEQSAESVFNSCVHYLRATDNKSIESLKQMVQESDLKTLRAKLAGSSAERYLSADGKTTASSILSVLASNSKPLSYLTDDALGGKFSLKEHFQNIKAGGSPWLFLATKPSSRELTLPLISCLTELAFTQLMDIGINKTRRVWFVIDELAALGRLPALPQLMTEGRKYGACVVSGMQSLNQLYSAYGQYDGSSIFGQFGSRFFFRNDEQAIAKMISDMCGSELLSRQQANISFGANEYRDGQSYTTQEKRQKLVEYSDISSLGVGECFVLLPEPEVRLSKLQTPEAKLQEKHEGFMQKKAAGDEDETIESESNESEGSSPAKPEDTNISSSSSPPDARGSSGGLLNYCIQTKPKETTKKKHARSPQAPLPKLEKNNELKKTPATFAAHTELEIGI